MKWYVPFTYKLEDSKNEIVWLNLTNGEVKIKPENYDTDKDKWYLANLNYMGFYKVNYDTENWYRLVEQLKKNHAAFTPTERAGLIYDAFKFAKY